MPSLQQKEEKVFGVFEYDTLKLIHKQIHNPVDCTS